ncbi:Serine/threonine-protein phosphatase 4 regulatory subunit 4-like, partial [Homarus americanus]
MEKLALSFPYRDKDSHRNQAYLFSSTEEVMNTGQGWRVGHGWRVGQGWRVGHGGGLAMDGGLAKDGGLAMDGGLAKDGGVHSGLSLLAGGGAGEGGGGIIGIESQGASQAPQEALSFLQGDLVPHTNFTHTFLKSILTSIDSKDPMVANAWLETLLDVIDLLPKEVIKDEILTLAVSKGQSQQVSARLAACKLIGKIATKLKTEVVGVVQSLCQDVCGEVRGSMCSQLAAVARGLGLDATKTHILPELVDLCSDEETNVRLAGINTVVLMIPLLDDETRVGTLVPLVRKVCERALRVEDASLPVTAHLLGRICHGLHDELTEEQKSWFLNFYCTLAKLGLPDSKKTELPMPDLVAEVRSGEYEAECRQQCAYNLPCMVAFAGGSTTYRTSLHDTVSSLVTDPSQQVRTTVAAAFHQLCTLVSSEVGLLKEGLLQLLRSENLDILAALIPNLPHIITTMHRNNAITPQSPRGELMELVGAIKQGEETVSITSLWRVHAEALTQAAALAPCLPSDLIFTQLVPLMFIRMQTARPIPCRLAAARTLLVYLRHMNTSEHREHISNTLVSGHCCLYIELETVVGSLLMSESDRDVSAAISTTITQLDKIEVCECQRGSPEGDSGGQETEDERKERQERRVVNGSKATDKKSPDGNRSEGGSLGERRSGQRSSRRSSGIGRLPPYLERRRSNSHAPKQPPDEHTILRDSLSGSRDRLSESRDRHADTRERISEKRSKPVSSRRSPFSALPSDNGDNGDRISEKLSAREVFWLRTSRPRWRRKVASADTSPEEPRRNRFGRGWSIDGRGSHSDTEDPDILYDGRRHTNKDNKVQSPSSHSTASPPSPHGMYTWPPQHTRHRHHSSSESEEYENEHEPNRHESSQRSGNYDAVSRRRSPPSHHYETSVLKNRHFDLSPRRSESLDAYNTRSHHSDKSSKRHNKITNYPESSSHYYSPSNKEETSSQKYNNSTRSLDPSPHHIQYISHPNENDSSLGGRQRERSSQPLHDSRPRRVAYPRDSEDPYIYHGLPPTLAPHLSAMYSAHSLPTHFSYDHPEDYLSSLAFTEPFSPDPYHAEMFAAAELYPREHYPPYGYDGDRPRGTREHETRMLEQPPHSYFLLDTAELAPWSSPPAYPIGPLGASWLQHGLHPLARIPPCLIPTPYSRPRPHPPLASPPWRLTHPASFPSMSTLDPTTDEFLVDAGIRIDESVIKSRLPTPQSNATRISRWRPSDRPYASHLSSSNEGGSMDNKSRGSNNLGGSRLRQPSTNTSVSRIPAPPGTLGHQNDSPRGQDEQSSNHRDSQTSSGTRRGSQGGSGSTGSNVVTRLRPPSRPSRPVSTVASSPSRGPLPSRTKSLSHENLRTSPSRLALPTSPTVSPNSSRAASPHTSPQETENRPRTLNVIGSRLRQPQVRTPRNRGSRPTSCSSSPGGSRCSSPGLDGPVSGFGRGSRSGSRNGSTSSSPATSRCSSPAAEDLRSLSRGSQHRSSASVTRGNSAMSRSSRHTSGSTPEQVTTPPSPIPSPRTQRQGSSIPKPSSVSRGKPAGTQECVAIGSNNYVSPYFLYRSDHSPTE